MVKQKTNAEILRAEGMADKLLFGVPKTDLYLICTWYKEHKWTIEICKLEETKRIELFKACPTLTMAALLTSIYVKSWNLNY